MAPRGVAHCRSQTSGGDVYCHKGVEAGAKPVAVLYANISVLNLMRAATEEPVQGDKERCDMGPFWDRRRPVVPLLLNHL